MAFKFHHKRLQLKRARDSKLKNGGKFFMHKRESFAVIWNRIGLRSQEELENHVVVVRVRSLVWPFESEKDEGTSCELD